MRRVHGNLIHGKKDHVKGPQERRSTGKDPGYAYQLTKVGIKKLNYISDILFKNKKVHCACLQDLLNTGQALYIRAMNHLEMIWYEVI